MEHYFSLKSNESKKYRKSIDHNQEGNEKFILVSDFDASDYNIIYMEFSKFGAIKNTQIISNKNLLLIEYENPQNAIKAKNNYNSYNISKFAKNRNPSITLLSSIDKNELLDKLNQKILTEPEIFTNKLQNTYTISTPSNNFYSIAQPKTNFQKFLDVFLNL